jgi:hypothetical protein
MDLATIYTPQAMLEAMSQKARPLTFLAGLFVKRRTTHTTPVVSIDVEKGGRKLAAYVSRTSNPNKVGKRSFSTNIHTAPYLSEEIDFTAENVILERLPGESALSPMSPRARQDRMVMAWLEDLQDRLINREEQQIAEALQTGKLHVAGNTVDYYVDYQMAGSHLVTLTGGDKWDSTGDKIAQLQAWAALTRDAGAPTSNVVVMGVDAANLFLKDTDVRKYMDMLRVDAGAINPRQFADQNATYLGNFRSIGLDIDVWSYQGKYTTDAGVATSFIDPANVILGSQQARAEFHYGPIFNLNHGTMVAEKFPYIYTEESGKVGHCALESSPLFGFHQPDAFVRATVK